MSKPGEPRRTAQVVRAFTLSLASACLAAACGASTNSNVSPAPPQNSSSVKGAAPKPEAIVADGSAAPATANSPAPDPPLEPAHPVDYAALETETIVADKCIEDGKPSLDQLKKLDAEDQLLVITPAYDIAEGKVRELEKKVKKLEVLVEALEHDLANGSSGQADAASAPRDGSAQAAPGDAGADDAAQVEAGAQAADDGAPPANADYKGAKKKLKAARTELKRARECVDRLWWVEKKLVDRADEVAVNEQRKDRWQLGALASLSAAAGLEGARRGLGGRLVGGVDPWFEAEGTFDHFWLDDIRGPSWFVGANLAFGHKTHWFFVGGAVGVGNELSLLGPRLGYKIRPLGGALDSNSITFVGELRVFVEPWYAPGQPFAVLGGFEMGLGGGFLGMSKSPTKN